MINHCLMRLRKVRRANFLYLDHPAEGETAAIELPDRRSTPEGELLDDEMSAVLHKEIRRLPPLLRNALVLRDLEELSMEDFAERLGISIVATKSRLLRARRELRQRLQSSLARPSPA